MHFFLIIQVQFLLYIFIKFTINLIKQTYGHGERGGGGEMYLESNMETYITFCKIDRQWEFAVCLRKLKEGLCINLEGWEREGDVRGLQKGGHICILMADSC